jgi:hypothetical protein
MKCIEAICCATTNSYVKSLRALDNSTQHGNFTFKMKVILLLCVFVASQHALSAFVPVHGCEWVTETTAVTNFTLFTSASNTSTTDHVQWQVPVHRVACSVSTTGIGTPGGASTIVPCTASSDPTNGQFRVLADDGLGRNAALIFVAYVQCAASIYAFYYRADFVLSCERDSGGSATWVPKGNVTATVTTELYLPPVSRPPPQPWWQSAPEKLGL